MVHCVYCRSWFKEVVRFGEIYTLHTNPFRSLLRLGSSGGGLRGRSPRGSVVPASLLLRLHCSSGRLGGPLCGLGRYGCDFSILWVGRLTVVVVCQGRRPSRPYRWHLVYASGSVVRGGLAIVLHVETEGRGHKRQQGRSNATGDRRASDQAPHHGDAGFSLSHLFLGRVFTISVPC